MNRQYRIARVSPMAINAGDDCTVSNLVNCIAQNLLPNMQCFGGVIEQTIQEKFDEMRKGH